MLTFILTFLVIFILIATIHQDDGQAWIRAILVAAVFVGVNIAVQTYGIIGWGIGGVIGLLVVMGVMKYTLSGAFFFVIIITLLQYFVGFGVEHYIK